MQAAVLIRAARVLCACALVAFVVPAQTAQTNTWIGLTSSVWTDGANWSLGAPPGAAQLAVIPPPGMGAQNPTIGLADVACGALTIQPGATLTLAGRRLSVGGAFANGGAIVGAPAAGAALVLTDGAVVSAFGACGVDVEAQSAFGAPATALVVPGNLFVPGSFQVGNFGSLAVGGNLVVDGGLLIVPNSLVLVDVAGDVTLQNLPQTTFATFQCGGDWHSDATYATASGTVTFDGAPPQTVTGAGLFPSVVVPLGSYVAAPVALDVAASLTVSGTLQTDAGVVVGSDTFGATVVTGTVLGPGALTITGLLTPVVGPNASIAHLEIAVLPVAALTLTADLTLTAAFTLTSGTLNLNGRKLTVNGPASFLGGALNGGGASELDLNGSAVFAGTVVGPQGPPQTIRAAGDWTASAAFDPTSGTTVFDGAAPQTISGSAPRFFHLTVAAGASVSATAPANVAGNLTASGALSLAAPLDLFGIPFVTGTVAGPAALRLVGTANAPLNIGSGVASLEVAKASNAALVNATGAVTLGALKLSTGRLSTAGNTIAVNGPAEFLGGVLTNGSFGGTFDFNGSATFSGATVDLFVPEIRCAGNWTADAAFAPFGGTVVFDGAAPQTLGGAGPRFSSLTIDPGASVALAAPVLVNANLAVQGALALAHQIDVGGTVSVPASGAVVGGALLRMFGTTSNLSGVVPRLLVEKNAGQSVNLSGTATTGELTANSGAVSCSGNTFTVDGPAAFTNAGLTNGSFGGQFDFNGDVALANVPNLGFEPAIFVAGNWTADGSFAPTSNTVTFDGAAPQTIGGAAPRFRNLTIAAGASVALAAPVVATGALSVQGSLALAHEIEVGGAVGVPATALLAGPAALRATGASSTAFGVVPRLVVAKNAGQTLALAGGLTTTELVATSGRVSCSGNTLTVNGPASFTNAGITNGSFGGQFDFNGDVSFANVEPLGFEPQLFVAGNWTADASFAPTAGTATFDGAAPQTIGGSAANFAAVVVAAGATVTAAAALNLVQGLTVQGTLALAADASVAGAVGVPATGLLTGPAKLRLVGAGATFAGALPRLEIAKSGTATASLAGPASTPELALLGGTLSTSGNTLSVAGNAQFLGGVLTNGSFGGAVDIEGDAVFAGTSMPGFPTDLRVAGDFTADAAFAPLGGTVELDGVAPSTLGPATPGGTLTFSTLRLKNGVRAPAGPQTWVAANVVVEPGSTLDLGATRVAVHRPGGPTTINANGALLVGAGGELALGPGVALSVGGTGLLSLVGAAGAPARLGGEAGGGYAATVGGTLAARHFVVERPGVGGFVVQEAATLAAAPNDLRLGVFDRPSTAPGARLLDVRRPTPTTFFELGFLNSAGAAGAANVRVQGGAPLTFQHWAGAFGGPAFENDAFNLCQWVAPAGASVAGFAATTGTYDATLSWNASGETAIASYLVERAPTLAGPFAPVATAAAAAAPSYAAFDGTLLAGDAYAYRLSFVTHTGIAAPLATTTTVAGPPAPPPANVLRVGPGGFASIQDAVNAATLPASVIAVAAGTYPAFTVSAAPPGGLRVVGAGAGATLIDTTAGPVRVVGLPFGAVCELADLTVGAPTSPFGAVEIVGCAGTTLVDGLVVDGGAGPDPFGVRATASGAVAVQRTQATGSPALAATTGSRLHALAVTATSASASGGSSLTLAGYAGPAPFADATSSTTLLPGAAPVVVAERLPRVNAALDVSYAGAPNAPWALLLGFGNAFVELGAPFDAPLFLDPAFVAVLDARIADGAGADVYRGRVPPLSALAGFQFEFQALTVDVALGVLRFSNARTVVVAP